MKFGIYDTVHLHFVGGPVDDPNEASATAAELTSDTGRLHEVRLVPTEPPGVAETAFLIATGTGATDNAAAPCALAADARYGALPDWITVVDGEAVLGEDAGGCVVSLVGQTNLDFTGTTAPDDPGSATAFYELDRDGTGLLFPDTGDPTVGDGSDLMGLPASVAAGDFVFGGTLSVTAGAGATDADDENITDGVATHTLAINVTRIAPVPTLSD